MPILQVRDLTKQYSGGKYAVNRISFDVVKGEILGILGANGAGKTTTISMLLGLLQPTTGSITYFGKDFFTHRSEIMQQVGYGTAYAQLPGPLTIWRNLDIYGRLAGLSSAERAARIQDLLEKLDMWHMRDRVIGGLSAGEITRVIIAKAFIANPAIVLLDEPTASLDVDISRSIRAIIADQQRERGVSFIITSHNMQEMTELCDRIIVMYQGLILTSSTPEGLAKTVHQSKLFLMLGDDLSKGIAFAEEHEIKYVVERTSIEMEIDEYDVAQTLIALANRGITYTQIGINKPSLEDYFISLQEQHRRKRA
jgi:ABC-2 type transport system ATP-binding protein